MGEVINCGFPARIASCRCLSTEILRLEADTTGYPKYGLSDENLLDHSWSFENEEMKVKSGWILLLIEEDGLPDVVRSTMPERNSAPPCEEILTDDCGGEEATLS